MPIANVGNCFLNCQNLQKIVLPCLHAKLGKMLPDIVAKNGHNYVYIVFTNASRKYSCHIRAFRAIANVTNHGKSVIVPKVVIFGNLWEAI